jgi:cell volume regulation protein A
VTLLDPGPTSLILLILGSAALVGFGSDFLATRFRVPDSLWLIALGILLGPLLGLVTPGELLGVAPILGAGALALILFDAGLDMRVGALRTALRPALALAGASYGASLAVLFAVGYVGVTGGNAPLALLFAAALGCTSGAVIIPLANRLGLPDSFRQIVQLESAFEDAAAVLLVSAITLVLAPAGTGSATSLTLTLVLPFPVGVALGAAGGILWLGFLSRWQNRPYAALATVGFLFVLYAVTQTLGGSGILAALVLGATIANERVLRRFLPGSRPFRLAPALRQVQGEIAFLLRSFFLLFVGVLLGLPGPGLLVLVVVSVAAAILVLVRTRVARGVTSARTLRPGWPEALGGLYARGLTSAALLVLVVGSVPSAQVLMVPSLAVIVATNAVMTVHLAILGRLGRLPRATSGGSPPSEPGGAFALVPETPAPGAGGRDPGSEPWPPAPAPSDSRPPLPQPKVGRSESRTALDPWPPASDP